MPLVVRVAASFIADIDPIAGIKKLTEAAPASTGLPEASAKVSVKSLAPLFRTPLSVARVTIRLLTEDFPNSFPPPEDLMADRPDFILILPWNLREEIAGQLAAAREWGAKFVVAIPEVQVF